MRESIAVVLALAAGFAGLAKVDPPPPAHAPAAEVRTVAPAEIVIQAAAEPPPEARFGWVPEVVPQAAQVSQGPCPGGICPLPAAPARAPEPVAAPVIRAVPQAVYRGSGACSSGSCAPARRGLFGRILGR